MSGTARSFWPRHQPPRRPATADSVRHRRRPSSSAGDYLKAVWEFAGDGTASTKAIAAKLRVKPASVTNMFARLHEMGLVGYERYRGAALTEEGRAEALRLIRCHRLIETFLLERLGYPWQEVHEAAQKLGNGVLDEEFAEKLAEHLGYPERDPYGAAIPATDRPPVSEQDLPLSEIEAGRRVLISRVRDEDGRMLCYLAERGIVPGKRLAMREARAIDGVVTVEDEAGNRYSLGRPVAASIFVRDPAQSKD